MSKDIESKGAVAEVRVGGREQEAPETDYLDDLEGPASVEAEAPAVVEQVPEGEAPAVDAVAPTETPTPATEAPAEAEATEPAQEPKPVEEAPVVEPELLGYEVEAKIDQGAPSQEELAEQRKQYVTALEKAYELPPDVEFADESLQGYLPKMAAELHVRVHETVSATVLGTVQQLVQQAMSQVSEKQSFTADFYNRWKELRSEQGSRVASQFVEAFRKANPSVSRKDLIEQAGAAAMINLGLPIEATNVIETPAPAPEPYTPAAAAPARSGSRQKRAPNVFVDMAEDDLMEIRE